MEQKERGGKSPELIRKCQKNSYTEISKRAGQTDSRQGTKGLPERRWVQQLWAGRSLERWPCFKAPQDLPVDNNTDVIWKVTLHAKTTLNQSQDNGMARDKQLEREYTNAKSLGSTTQEPDQLVHVVRPDAASMQERGWNGNWDWKTGVLGNVIAKKEKNKR